VFGLTDLPPEEHGGIRLRPATVAIAAGAVCLALNFLFW